MTDMSESSGPDMMEGNIICPDCETQNSAERFVCSHCGAPLSESTRMSPDWLRRWGWISALSAYLLLAPALTGLLIAAELHKRDTESALKITLTSLGALSVWILYWTL